MGELTALDAKHNHPITQTDGDLKKEPPTISERNSWLIRDNRQRHRGLLPL